MTDELIIRRAMARGNGYLNVVNYAIRVLNDLGEREVASWVVAARDNVTEEARDGRFPC